MSTITWNIPRETLFAIKGSTEEVGDMLRMTSAVKLYSITVQHLPFSRKSFTSVTASRSVAKQSAGRRGDCFDWQKTPVSQ